jgi:hypothetical protein
MAIIKRPGKPARPSTTAEAFIQGAPDAGDLFSEAPPAGPGVMLGKQRQVSLAMPPELLARVDETARKLSLTRAGFMKLALTRAVEAEESR